MVKNLFRFALLFVVALSVKSCSKKAANAVEEILNNDDGSVCDSIAKIKIRGVKSSYYVGDSISLSVSNVPNIAYKWTQENKVNSVSNGTTFDLRSCTKNDQGWIYVVASNNKCTTNIDSVYLNIVNVPVTPPCSPTNNVIQFSTLPDLNFTNTYWNLSPTWNRMSLSGSSGSFGVYFNQYWNTKEPEDGVYDIANSISFSGVFSVYSVFISTISQSIYYSSNNTSEKVYVTHQNGKIQVSICDVTLGGSFGGTPVQTKITGKITAP